MIKLTRFNHTEVIVNADLIEFLEATPDTVVTLVTSRKVLVRETVDEIIARIIEYRQKAGARLLAVPVPGVGSGTIEP